MEILRASRRLGRKATTAAEGDEVASETEIAVVEVVYVFGTTYESVESMSRGSYSAGAGTNSHSDRTVGVFCVSRGGGCGKTASHSRPPRAVESCDSANTGADAKLHSDVTGVSLCFAGGGGCSTRGGGGGGACESAAGCVALEESGG